MPFVNNATSVRDWLRSCPEIKPDKPFDVDYTSGEATYYSLFSVPTEIKYKTNVLGETAPLDEQSLDFVFASIEGYGESSKQHERNLGFYQKIVAWIIEQSEVRNLPAINGGTITSIKPTLTAYVIQAGASSARYQINIKITYRRV